MLYILDTDVIDSFFDAKKIWHQKIREHVLNLNNDDNIGVSILTLFELHYSLSNSPVEKQQMILNTIEEIKRNFTIIYLNENIAKIYGYIKNNFKVTYEISRKNMKTHNIDLIIASTAIVTNSILVCNDDIYTRLAEIDQRLKIQNWLK